MRNRFSPNHNTADYFMRMKIKITRLNKFGPPNRRPLPMIDAEWTNDYQHIIVNDENNRTIVLDTIDDLAEYYAQSKMSTLGELISIVSITHKVFIYKIYESFDPVVGAYIRHASPMEGLDEAMERIEELSTDLSSVSDCVTELSTAMADIYTKNDVDELIEENNITINKQINNVKGDVKKLNQQVTNLTVNVLPLSVDTIKSYVDQKVAGGIKFIGTFSKLPDPSKYDVGSIVIVKSKEYILDEKKKWQELGDEGLYVTKTKYNADQIVVNNNIDILSSDINTLTTSVTDVKNSLSSYVKTVNGKAPDANGNVEISAGGGSVVVDMELSETSVNPVANKVITKVIRELESKMTDKLEGRLDDNIETIFFSADAKQ